MFRLSKREREKLAEQAESLGMKMADYVRSRIFGYRLPKRQLVIDEKAYQVLSQLAVDVRKAGGNINQLAHGMHLGLGVKVDEVQAEISDLKRLLHDLRSALVKKAPDPDDQGTTDPDDQDTSESDWEDGDR